MAERNPQWLASGSPAAGVVVALQDIPDPVFAAGSLGPGVALELLDALVRAPCDAEVFAIARTGHAVTLRAANGAEILIHIGLETVALDAEGFELLVQAGYSVSAGEPLVRLDINAIDLQVKSLCTPIIVLNGGDFLVETYDQPRLLETGSTLLKIAPRLSRRYPVMNATTAPTFTRVWRPAKA